MLIWVVKWIIISLIIIILSENILNFLKKNYSVPETKDYISIQDKMYKNIYNIIKEDTNDSPEVITQTNITDKDKEHMKNELKKYIKEDLEKEQILMLNENSNYYSEYI